MLDNQFLVGFREGIRKQAGILDFFKRAPKPLSPLLAENAAEESRRAAQIENKLFPYSRLSGRQSKDFWKTAPKVEDPVSLLRMFAEKLNPERQELAKSILAEQLRRKVALLSKKQKERYKEQYEPSEHKGLSAIFGEKGRVAKGFQTISKALYDYGASAMPQDREIVQRLIDKRLKEVEETIAKHQAINLHARAVAEGKGTGKPGQIARKLFREKELQKLVSDALGGSKILLSPTDIRSAKEILRELQGNREEIMNKVLENLGGE